MRLLLSLDQLTDQLTLARAERAGVEGQASWIIRGKN